MRTKILKIMISMLIVITCLQFDAKEWTVETEKVEAVTTLPTFPWSNEVSYSESSTARVSTPAEFRAAYTNSSIRRIIFLNDITFTGNNDSWMVSNPLRRDLLIDGNGYKYSASFDNAYTINIHDNSPHTVLHIKNLTVAKISNSRNEFIYSSAYGDADIIFENVKFEQNPFESIVNANWTSETDVFFRGTNDFTGPTGTHILSTNDTFYGVSRIVFEKNSVSKMNRAINNTSTIFNSSRIAGGKFFVGENAILEVEGGSERPIIFQFSEVNIYGGADVYFHKNSDSDGVLDSYSAVTLSNPIYDIRVASGGKLVLENRDGPAFYDYNNRTTIESNPGATVIFKGTRPTNLRNADSRIRLNSPKYFDFENTAGGNVFYASGSNNRTFMVVDSSISLYNAQTGTRFKNSPYKDVTLQIASSTGVGGATSSEISTDFNGFAGVDRIVFEEAFVVKFLKEDETTQIGFDQKIVRNETATAETPPNIIEHKFIGWKDKDTGNIITDINSYLITKDTTFIATYKINQYDITYKDEDGSILAKHTYDYNSAITNVPVPTKPGYNLKGWKDKNSVFYATLSGTLVKTNREFTAVYQKNDYTVTYNNYDGTKVKTEQVSFENNPVSPPTMSREGHTFVGWSDGTNTYSDLSNYTVKSDVVFTAVYDVIAYTVTYKNEDGSTISTESVDYGTSPINIPVPTKTGHTFIGWKNGTSLYSSLNTFIVKGHITFTAEFKVNIYTVKYTDFDNTQLGTESVEYGASLSSIPTPTRVGYTFVGWNDGVTTHTDLTSYVVKSNVVLKAQYKAKLYTVTYKNDDGSVISTEQVEYNSSPSNVPTASKEGHTHIAWNDGTTNYSTLGSYKITGDVTFTAVYNVNHYTVKYYNYNSIHLSDELVKYNEKPQNVPTPTRLGYTFVGWNDGTTTYADLTNYVVKGNVSLTAVFEAKTYTVTYNDHDGTQLKTELVAHDKSPVAAPNPSRTGYTFVGWNDGTQLITNLGRYTVTQDVTLTAQYEINTYDVTYQLADGTELGSEEVDYNNSPTNVPSPTKVGYTFTGWYDGNNTYSNLTSYLVTENTTFTAKFTINSYTVSYVDYDNSPISTELVDYKEFPAAIPTPTRTGYTFVGWESNSIMYLDLTTFKVTGNVTFKAVYSINSYTVTYNDYDNTLLSQESVIYGSNPTYSTAPTRVGYTFVGWNDGTSTHNNISSFVVTGDTTFTAEYTINNYTVTYKDDDGTQLSTELVDYKENPVAAPTPTKTGHTFVGWSDGTNTYTDLTSYKVISDVTLTAIYTVNTYVVTYIDHDGVLLDSENVNYEDSPANIPAVSREGYTFIGWNDGTSISANITTYTVTADVTFTATYSINSYTVKYLDSDASTLGTETVTYNTMPQNVPTPTKTGYTFVGWSDRTTTYTDLNGYVVKGNVTFTAQYEINSYEVTFKDFNGTLLHTEDVDYNENIVTIPTATRVGYVFKHWSDGTNTYTDLTSYQVTSDVIFTAVYEKAKYNVTYNDYDSTTLGTEQVIYNESPATIPTATRTGYTFAGWNDGTDTYLNLTLYYVKSDVVFTATYTVNTYTITYNDYDGNTLGTESVDYNESPQTVPTPTRTGYTFAGWNDGTTTHSDLINYHVTGDVTLTAVYTINSYEVTFKDYEGTVLHSEDVDYNDAPLYNTAPTRIGYSFTGWNDGTTVYSSLSSYQVTSDTVFTAEYSINTYTVKYHNYDGSSLGFESVEYKKSPVNPPTATREGHTFKGWSNGSELFTDLSNLIVKSNVKLTAVYTVNTYKVTYTDDADVTLDTEDVNYNGNPVSIPTPTKQGYTFTGWSDGTTTYADLTNYVVKGDITFKAVFEINKYTVTFYDHDLLHLGTETVSYNESPQTSPTGSKPGHTFIGWSDGTTTYSDLSTYKITADTSFYAMYKVNKYTVTYNDEDNSLIDTESVEYGKIPQNEPTPTKTGYTHVGWSDGRKLYRHLHDYYVKEDVTLTAVYRINSYTVTYVDYNNVKIDEEVVTYNSNVVGISDPTRVGHTFVGWNDGTTTHSSLNSYAVTSDVTFKATYKANTYKVTFSNDGQDTMGTIDGSVAGEVVLPIEVPYGKAIQDTGQSEPNVTVKPGYYLYGWRVQNDITGSLYNDVCDYPIITDTVFIPVYDNTLYVNFNFKTDFEGNINVVKSITGLTPGDLVSDGVGSIPNADVRKGYTFSHWVDELGNTVSDSDINSTVVMDVLTFKAVYNIKSHTVVFKEKDGTQISTETLNYNSTPTAVTAPNITGHTFIGWNDGTSTYNDLSEYKITSDTVFTATYKLNEYTVIYHDDDDDDLGSEKVKYGQSPTNEPTPTKVGHTFTGWDDGTVIHTNLNSYTVTDDIIFHATYTPIAYSVTYNDYDNTQLSTESVDYGTSPQNVPVAARTGYTFVGWSDGTNTYSDISKYVIKDDTVFTATYKINTYTVTYLNHDLSTIKTEKVNYNNSPQNAPVATKPGHTFSGWSDGTTTYTNLSTLTVTGDITLTAQFTVNSYTVTYEDDGVTLGTESVNYNSNPTSPPTASKPGYTFVGWNDGTTTYSNISLYVVKGDVVLTAAYKINKYTVTYYNHDLQLLGTEEVEYEDNPENAPVATKDGHTFVGWSDGNTTYLNLHNISVKSNLDLTAVFKINKYTVTYEDDSGNQLGTESVTYDASPVNEPVPTKAGHTFVGWSDGTTTYTDLTSYVVKGDVTMKAVFTINSYTLTYKDHDGLVLDTLTQQYNTVPASSPTPTRTGYTFSGWTDGTTTYTDMTTYKITDDTTLIAVYTVNNYKVTYTDYDDSEISSEQVDYLDNPNPPTPTRTGYTFSGWTDGTTNYLNLHSYIVKGDVTFKAVYTINTYLVTYNDDFGSLISTESVNYNSNPSAIPTPIKAGHTFVGWSDGTTTYSDLTSYAVTDNVTFTAQFKINDYTVTYNDYDATLIDKETVTYDDNPDGITAPTRTGYTFSGWSDGTTVYTDITSYVVKGDVTFTAVYTINSYTVVFIDYEGTILDSDTINYGSNPQVVTNPTRVGYTFVGWSDGTTTYTDLTSYIVEGDTSFTAVYKIIDYTVTYNDYDNSLITSEEVTFNSSPTNEPTPTRTGYTFTGWSDGTNIYPDLTLYIVKSDVTFTATYDINNYNVTYKDFDGQLLAGEVVPYNNTLSNIPTPTRTGYTFVGWNDGTTTHSDLSSYTVKGDVEFKAEYKINKYTVIFKDYDGTVIDTQTINYNELITNVPTATRTGYTFTGWHDTDTLYTILNKYRITEDVTFTANYKINSYTVVYLDDDSSFIKREAVKYNNNPTRTPTPTQVGHTFAGWSDGITTYTSLASYNVTNNVTFTAVYEPLKYTVTYKDDDGSVVGSEIVSYGSYATSVPVMNKVGHNFTGWNDGTALYDNLDTYKITANTDFTAEYSPKKFNVVFHTYTDELISHHVLQYGSLVPNETAPTRVGYTFVGWNDGTTIHTNLSSYVVTGDVEFDAEYVANTYTITYNDYDGTTISTETVSHNERLQNIPAPTRIGYTFAGWSDGTNDYDDISEYIVTSATTFTAIYQINTYKVIYDDYDGTTLNSEVVNYNGNLASIPTPTRVGHDFAGWSDGINTYTTLSSYVVHNDVVFVAQYTPKTYTYTYVDENMSFISSENILYNNLAQSAPEPTKVGYTFAGWLYNGIVYENLSALPATQSIMLVATYKINLYDVTFLKEDGELIRTDKVAYSTVLTSSPNVDKEGHHFGGWDDGTVVFPDLTSYVVYGDVTFRAKYTTKDYVVSFSNDGQTSKGDFVDPSAIVSMLVPYDKSIFDTTNVVPQMKANTDYYFAGWRIYGEDPNVIYSSVRYLPIKDDTLFIAVYKKPFIAKFTYYTDFDGHVQLSSYISAIKPNNNISTGDGIIPNADVREGYTFKHWQDQNGNIVSYRDIYNISVSGNLDFTAVYEINTNVVTYKDYDGTIFDTEIVNYSSTPQNVPVPTREGYTFVGWIEENEDSLMDLPFRSTAILKTLENCKIYSNTTFTAVYTINKYDITFVVDGKNLVVINDKFGSVIPKVVAPLKTGYTFSHWVDNDGKIWKLENDVIPAKNVVLTAVYTRNPIQVQFIVDGKVYQVIEGREHSLIEYLKAPNKLGYTFKHWIDSTGKVWNFDIDTLTDFDSIRLFAVYDRKVLPVTGFKNYIIINLLLLGLLILARKLMKKGEI